MRVVSSSLNQTIQYRALHFRSPFRYGFFGSSNHLVFLADFFRVDFSGISPCQGCANLEIHGESKSINVNIFGISHHGFHVFGCLECIFLIFFFVLLSLKEENKHPAKTHEKRTQLS